MRVGGCPELKRTDGLRPTSRMGQKAKPDETALSPVQAWCCNPDCRGADPSDRLHVGGCMTFRPAITTGGKFLPDSTGLTALAPARFTEDLAAVLPALAARYGFSVEEMKSLAVL